MSLENELDDLKIIKQEISKLNALSHQEATKVEKKLSGIKNRLNKLKIIEEEYKILGCSSNPQSKRN